MHSHVRRIMHQFLDFQREVSSTTRGNLHVADGGTCKLVDSSLRKDSPPLESLLVVGKETEVDCIFCPCFFCMGRA